MVNLRIFKALDYETTITRAKDRFSFKPYPERWAHLQGAAKAGKFTLPLISIGTGIFFLAGLLKTSLPIWLAYSLAGLFLAGWEVAKAGLITNSFEAQYTGRKLGIGLMVLVLAFSTGSAFVSIQGAKELYKATDTTTSQIQAGHDTQRAQILNGASNKIEAIEGKIQAIEQHKSKRWGGLLSASENRQILNYQNQIAAIEKSTQAELERLASGHEKEVSKATSEAGFNVLVFGGLAGLVDALIILAGWYLVYFDFKSLQELQVLKGGTSTQPFQAPEKTIGFQTAASLNQGLASGNQENGDKRARLEQLIADGVKDYRVLCGVGFNVQQVKAAIDKCS